MAKHPVVSDVVGFFSKLTRDVTLNTTHDIKAHFGKGTLALEQADADALYEKALALWQTHPHCTHEYAFSEYLIDKVTLVIRGLEQAGVAPSTKLQEIIYESYARKLVTGH